MQRDFDDVSFKNKGKTETINLALSKFDGGDESHTVTADVTGRTLKITATVDGKNYGLQIDDVDLEPGTKVEKGKGQFKVQVAKTGDFSLEDKYKG